MAKFGDCHLFQYDLKVKHTLGRCSVATSSPWPNWNHPAYYHILREDQVWILPTHIDEYIFMQVRHVFFLLCQFVNYMEVTKLPVYHPSQQEKDDPRLYAENVRRLMAHEVGILIKCVTIIDVYGQWMKWTVLLSIGISFCLMCYKTLLML